MSNGNPHIFVDIVPLLNEEYLNVVKVVSKSMGIGLAKAILISLTAVSSSCDFLVWTFMFSKSMQCAMECLCFLDGFLWF